MDDYLTESPTDSELLERIKNGDFDAFTLIYERYWRLTFNESLRRVRDHKSAEDIAQDIFMQFWLRRETISLENVPAYLFIAIKNRALKLREKKNRFIALPMIFEEFFRDSANADDHILQKELIDSYESALSSLTASQNKIFKMYYQEAMDTAQIAITLGIKRKTVQNQLRKATIIVRGRIGQK